MRGLTLVVAARYARAMRGSVTVHMAAPADRVWDLVSDVTESFKLPSTPLTRLYWLIFGFARGRSNADGMRVTLEKMKAAVESA